MSNSSVNGLKQIPWNELKLTLQNGRPINLGQGSYGVVVKANWHRLRAHPVPVAVKVIRSLSSRGHSNNDSFEKLCAQAKQEAEICFNAEKQMINRENIVLVYGYALGKLPESVCNLFRLQMNEEGVGIVMRLESGENPFAKSSAGASRKVAKASKKTDMYSFAILMWEVLSRKVPFYDLRLTDVALCMLIHSGDSPNDRPNLSEIPADIPPFLIDMMKACWSNNRSERKTAVECLMELQRANLVYASEKLFISIAEFENEDWTSDDSPSTELLQRLRLALEPLVKVLINDFACKPSLNQVEFDTEENDFSLIEEMRPLDSLSIMEVSALLESLNLQKYIPKYLENEVDGNTLNCVDSTDDVKELGIDLNPKAKLLFTKITEFKNNGVPSSLIKNNVNSSNNDLKLSGNSTIVRHKNEDKSPPREKITKDEVQLKEDKLTTKKEEDDEPEPDYYVDKNKNEHPFKILDRSRPSPFIMDTWKKTYMNCDDYHVAMNIFWSTLDSNGWSIFRCDYKYNEENTMLFMTSNLIVGFIQRTEAIEKWLFGTLTIRGEEKQGCMKITGYFLIRGDSIQPLIAACIDYAEHYTWTKMNMPASQKDKAVLYDYWCSEGPLEGEPCLDSRICNSSVQKFGAKAANKKYNADSFESSSSNKQFSVVKDKPKSNYYPGKWKKQEKSVEQSLCVLEVYPWEADTDLEKVWYKIKEYEQEGLLWGDTFKLEPVAFGIKKLVITCVIVDNLVLLDDIIESIESLEEWVQSAQVTSMNKFTSSPINNNMNSSNNDLKLSGGSIISKNGYGDKSTHSKDETRLKEDKLTVKKVENDETESKKNEHYFKILDRIKPSPFIMDTWKKTYSNCDDYHVAMNTFWSLFDSNDWSVFRCDYKYNAECKILFMTSNLIAGFIQRTEVIRKWLFGTLTIRGEEKQGCMKITGYFLIRGDSIQPLIACNDDAEYYTWTKMNMPASQKDKSLLYDYWCSEGPLEGEPCLDSRVYK
eukprot:gene12273-16459_t